MTRAFKKFAEIAGWYGAFASLAAYGLVSFNMLRAESFTYQILNLTGSIGILIIAAVKGVGQSVLLSLLWSLIAIAAIINLIFAH